MEKWRKEREIERERDRKKKEQESAEAISGLKNILPFIINITLETCHLNNFYFPTVQYRARVGAMQWFSIIQHDTHLYPNFTVH